MNGFSGGIATTLSSADPSRYSTREQGRERERERERTREREREIERERERGMSVVHQRENAWVRIQRRH